MTATANPFTDSDLTGALYSSPGRLARRTQALHAARVSGRHAGQVIAELACQAVPPGQVVVAADVGCGRGTTTRLLAERLPAARIVPVDRSAAMLTTTRSRSPRVVPVCADFHRLPFRDGACGLIVAAFCLYHSACPWVVASEFARCLRPRGTVIAAVKSAGSYRELDQVVAASGLDLDALSRPSLYQAVHGGNVAAILGARLTVRRVFSDTHVFRFPTLADAAEYLATSPKYQLPVPVRGDPTALAAALRQRLPDGPVTATSVVTYVTATREADVS